MAQTTQKKRFRARHILLTLAALSLLAVVAVWALAQVSWRVRGALDVVSRIPVSELRLTARAGGETITLDTFGLTLAGDLYRPANPDGSAVVLLHGSSPYGRKLALYPVLAKALADRGHTVLSIDQRGFGDSEDPDRSSVDGMDATHDVVAALDFLETLPGIDPGRMHLIGHSLGGGVAMAAMVVDPRPASVTAIGPPRRTPERMRDQFDTLRARYRHDRQLGADVPEDVFRAHMADFYLENLLPYLGGPGHIPLLLLDGGLEDPVDLAYLGDYAARVAPPFLYGTVAGTHHYLNTVGRLSPGVAVYDQGMLDQVVDAISGWMKTPGVQPGSP